MIGGSPVPAIGGGDGGSAAFPIRGQEVMGVGARTDFPEPTVDKMMPRIGQPGRYKWLFAAIWLIYMVDPLVNVVHSHHTPQWKLLNYAVTAVFVGCYGLLAYAVYPRYGELGTPVRAPRLARPVLLGMAVIAFATCLWINSDLAGMWVYVGTGTGLALPLEGRRAFRGVLAVVGLMTLCVVLAAGATSTDWLELALPTFFAGMSTVGIRQLSLVIGQLREARAAVGRLAASEERLRLARDLHDLTGHSLSLITLKAELAQRMIHKVRDAAADTPLPRLDDALKEVEEIEQVSRQTLTDIREAVSGYRRATLVVEMAAAYTALEAAGIKLDADDSVAAATGEFDADSEAALAWSLREAVTNVIRHSGATRVSIALRRGDGEALLTVRNNGCGLAATIGATDTFGGNGLTGLRERLDAVGGRLSVGGTDGDFRLVAAVPEYRAGSAGSRVARGGAESLQADGGAAGSRAEHSGSDRPLASVSAPASVPESVSVSAPTPVPTSVPVSVFDRSARFVRALVRRR
jgi:two-component system sensor histidine kinase DesK